MIPPKIIDELVDTLDSIPSECSAYMNKKTYEIFIETSFDGSSGWDDEDEEDEDLDFPDWEREERAKLREVRNSDDWICLPSAYEVHEWEIMRDFALSQDEEVSQQLMNAIHGKGAFRFFRAELDRLDLTDQWHALKMRP